MPIISAAASTPSFPRMPWRTIHVCKHTAWGQPNWAPRRRQSRMATYSGIFSVEAFGHNCSRSTRIKRPLACARSPVLHSRSAGPSRADAGRRWTGNAAGSCPCPSRATILAAQPRQRGPAAVPTRACTLAACACVPLHFAFVQFASAQVHFPQRRYLSCTLAPTDAGPLRCREHAAHSHTPSGLSRTQNLFACVRGNR